MLPINIDSILTAAAPLILASLGAYISVEAVVLCIAIDGFMNAGAFLAWTFSAITGEALISILLVQLLVMMSAAALMLLVLRTKANPFIAALAYNLFIQGAVTNLSQLLFSSKGVLTMSGVTRTAAYTAPVLQNFFIPALLATCIVYIIVSKTRIGLRLRITGINPLAAKELGINVDRYYVLSWSAAAFLAAAGGAAITWRVNAHVPGAAAGRPWIALALVYLGGRKSYLIFAAAILFAFIDYLFFSNQNLFKVSATPLGLPNLVALLLYIVSSRRRNGA